MTDKKRSLKKTNGEGNNSTFKEISQKQPSLLPKINNMLDKEAKYDFILEMIEEQGFKVSKSALSGYKKKLQEARDKNIAVESILDRRSTSADVYDISGKEITEWLANDDPRAVDTEYGGGNGGGGGGDDRNTPKKLFDQMEFIDRIIDKADFSLDTMNVVDLRVALKAMELKSKITNNQLGSISIAGLKQLLIRQQALEEAMFEAMSVHVPDEKQDAFLETYKASKQEYFDAMDLSERDKQAIEALKEVNPGLDI